MGRGRLPQQKAVSRRLVVLAAACLVAAAACRGGSGPPAPTAAPETVTPTATTAPPTATATPDPLAQLPETAASATAWVKKAIEVSAAGACPAAIVNAGGKCATGAASGSGASDVAILLPVKSRAAVSPAPAMVFAWSASQQKLTPFSEDLTADAGPLGSGFFSFEDRTGDGLADIAYLQNVCGATGCTSRAVVLSWDGTAWRDVGPGDSIANVDAAAWEGAGASSELTMHGGKLPPTAPPESGPTRASKTTYTLSGGRFRVDAVVKDPPEYLYHAVEDADDAFAADPGNSRAAYEKVIASKDLKDWKLKPGDADRRPSLVGYAMFRLAVIDAALGRDPTAALDRVIRESKEPLFVYLAESFRNGFQARGGVVGGCAEANLYLRTPQGSGTDPGGYVAQLFNYGYANPPGSRWIAKLCPY